MRQIQDVKLMVEKEEWILKDCIYRREVLVEFGGVEKKLTHIQIMNWPDHSQPDEDYGYLTIEKLLTIICEYRHTFPNSPVLTHCSAGTGRTGSLIAIFNLVKSLAVQKMCNEEYVPNAERISPFFSVFNVVRKLREQRMGMVSSWEQYKYIYEFIDEWINRNFNVDYEMEMN